MASFKPLDELTLMDDYMFGVVMQDPVLLRPLLEYILNIRIRSVEYIEPQRTMKDGYVSRGIRVDPFVTDEQGNVTGVKNNRLNLAVKTNFKINQRFIVGVSVLPAFIGAIKTALNSRARKQAGSIDEEVLAEAHIEAAKRRGKHAR